MHYEFIGGLEVTYGNALAGGGGFHRVTTAEGAAAEVTPNTYLWYKLSTNASGSSPPTSLSGASPGGRRSSGGASPSGAGGGGAAIDNGITDLRIAGDELDASVNWIKLDKSIDRQRGLFLWYQCAQFQAPTLRSSTSSSSSSSSTSTPPTSGQRLPLKEIRVVRDLKDIPEGFECLRDEPIVSDLGNGKELRTYLCFRRLGNDDFSGSKWSIQTQKVGNWIEVKDLSSNQWFIAQILNQSATEIRVHIATWLKGRDEYLTRATCRNRVAKLGTHTNLYLSPSYPFTRKQGSMWNVNSKDLQQAREDFDRLFYDESKHDLYLQRHLIPFVEKSLLCTIPSSELADDMNAFHQHVVKNVVAYMLSASREASILCMLSLLRMILNGHNSCMFFYLKYQGSYSATKHQQLVYTSYLVNVDALAAVPTRHPCRSLYFIDNVDLFIQAGGFRVILQRLALEEVPLTEVVVYCMLLNQAKPCLAQQKRRRSSSSRRRSTVDIQVEAFFRDFLNAVFARLRRMSGNELKDDDRVIDQIVGILEHIYRDGVLLGSNADADADDVSSAADGSSSGASDIMFAEAIEVFHLDLSKKFVCCPFLGQRLHGLSRINDLIAMAQRREALQKKTTLSLRRSSSSLTSAATALTSSSGYSTRSAYEQPAAKWLRPKYVVEWLIGSDVLEVILGDKECCAKYGLQEGTHLEILKRSRRIFEFVASNGLLSDSHVVLLWKTALNQLRSGRKTIFDVLVSLCGVLSAELMDVLAVLLTQVPLGDYDELLVHFIKRVVFIASKQVVDNETGGFKMSLSSLVSAAAGSKTQSRTASSGKDVEVFNKIVNLGCCLLWNAIMQVDANGERLRASVRSDVEGALAECLNHIQKLWAPVGSSSTLAKEQLQLLNEYLLKCAENIKAGVLVETSMNLIERVVEGFGHGVAPSASLSLSKGPQAPSSASDLLKELNSTHNIVQLVTEDIRRYMADATSGASANTSTDGAILQRRLSFLGYIVTNSDITLTFEAMGELWACFNDNPASTAKTRDIFFVWFTEIIPDPNNFVHRAYSGNTAFSDAVAREIFQALVSAKPTAQVNGGGGATGIHLQLEGLGKHSFLALERLFRFINTSDKLISCSSAASSTLTKSGLDAHDEPAPFIVESMDLKGLDTLYDAALCAEDEDVSQLVVDYIIYLHLHVGSKLVRREVWSDFVGVCLARIRTRMSASPSEKETREVRRLLMLLNTFLNQSTVQISDGMTSALDGPEELTVYVKTQDGRIAAPFKYYMRRTTLVSELRDRISKDTGHPADRIRIVNEQKTKLTAQGHGKFTLEKARVFSAVPTAQTGGGRYSSAITVPAPQQRSSKREFAYVEAVLLSKVESDTTGHTNRTVVDYHGNALTGTGAGAGNNTSVESDWRMVKSEISHNDRWVELLFGLLSWSDGIAEEVWKVLKLLDSNYEMEKRTRTLNDVLAIDGSIRKFPSAFDWNVLLDISCPPKLLYQLELVEKFALCVDARPEDDDQEGSQRPSEKKGSEGFIGAVNTWSSSFLQLGGKAHLEQFVLTTNHEHLIRQGKLSVMCLSKLLKLLRHFVLVEASIAEEDGDEVEGNPEGLVRKLLQLLSVLQATEERVSATKTDDKAVARSRIGLPLHLMPYARPQVGDYDNPEDIPCEAYLMTRTLSFIATCALTAMQNALSLLKAYSNHEQLFLRCLVESPFQAVRREAAGVIVALSTTKNKDEADRAKCCSFFLEVLGRFDGDVIGDEYYEVYTLLVSSATDLAEFAFLVSCRILCRRIKSFEPPSESIGRVAPKSLALVRSPTVVRPGVSVSPVSSRYAAPPMVDTQLQAIMTTLLTIIRRIPAVLAEGDSSAGVHSLREVVAANLHHEEGIMAELFHRCLFATPTTNENGDTPQSGSGDDSPTAHYYLQQPKCRSDSCRKVAFDLLSELSIDNASGLSYLLVQMGSQHSLERPPASVVGPSGASALSSSSSKRKSASVMKEASSSSRQLMQRGKYVGLKNLGCTCYLNSTIQCFFMIPRFRRQILRLTSGSSGADEPSLLYELQSLFAHLEGSAKPYYNPRPFTRAMKTWDGESIDVSVQQDASEFLTSFFQQIESEMNGMDNGVVGGDCLGDENILNTFFGGEFSNELVAEGDRYSERFEPFHFISVPVRDRKNLKESLDGWVEGEKVSYTWESSKNAEDGDGAQTPDGDGEAVEKVTLETHKRISISKLPEYLIIHLKRFEFDFEKMQQIKLHDRFEFPTELDMHPYTKEGQQEKRRAAAAAAAGSSHTGGEDGSADAKHDGSGDGSRLGSNDNAAKRKAPEYSQYELVGTVVHMGSAHSGHYYSFLREQGVSTGEDESTHHWYEFNDTLVTPFDPEQIPNECFGGEDESPNRFRTASTSVSGAGNSGSSASFMKNRSSFMLIYSRARPVLQREGSTGNAVAAKTSAAISSFAAGALAVAFCTRLLFRASPRLERLRSKVHVVAPESIRKQIALENRLFWRKKYLYDARCLQFTYELVSSCLVGLESAKSKAMLPTFEPEEAQFDALTMATKFVFGTLWQGGDVGKVLEWRLVLQALYHSDVDGCRWLLKTMSANETLLLELLVLNEHREVRALAASVLAEAIATTSNAGFDSSSAGQSEEVVGDRGKLPASFDFVFFLLTLMPALLTAPAHYHGEYFATIYEFVQMGRNEGSFLVVNGVVGAVVALLTGLSASSPLAPPLLAPQLQQHKPRQILKRIDLSGQVLKLLSVLVRCALPPAMDSADRVALPPNMAHDHVDLPKLDRDLLVNERFLTLLSQRASRYSSRETKPLEQLVAHLCWESRRVSTRFIEIVMAGVEREDHQDVKPYFRTLNSLFKVRDTLREWRVAEAMPQLVAVMASQQRFYKATETSMDMLTRLAKRHGVVIRWLRDNRANCTWMDKWLAAHRGPEGLLQQRKTLLVKPNSTSSWVNVSVSSSGLVKAVDRAIAKLLPRVRALLDVEAMPETFYDSDDNPARLVGRRVRVKWAKDKWYEGVVERFDEETYEHFVVYDDGDQRSYHMSDKIFYVVAVAPPDAGGESVSRRQQ